MAITEANDDIGSAGLTNRNKQSCGNIKKIFFDARWEKYLGANSWTKRVGE